MRDWIGIALASLKGVCTMVIAGAMAYAWHLGYHACAGGATLFLILEGIDEIKSRLYSVYLAVKFK